jgi:ABC-type uncharacterized transport system permease subunit
MLVVLPVLKILLPALYLIVWGFYLWLFKDEHPLARRWCSRLAVVTVLLHIGALVLQSIALGRLPMGAAAEFFSSLALAMTATYLVIEKWLKAKSTGFLVLGTAFLFQLSASFFSPPAPQPNPILSDPGFAGHAVLVLLSYTALSLSFLFASLYLVQVRQLGRRQFGLLFRRLPPLDTLEKMSVGAVQLGVPLLFLSLALGHLWMYDLADRVPPEMAAKLSPYDPKVLVSWVIFLGYTVGLVGHRFFGWRGRRMNLLAVSAYLAIIVTMGAIHHFVPSFHNFRSTDTTVTTPGGQQPATVEEVGA